MQNIPFVILHLKLRKRFLLDLIGIQETPMHLSLDMLINFKSLMSLSTHFIYSTVTNKSLRTNSKFHEKANIIAFKHDN